MTTHTTLAAIRKHLPCEDGWEKLLKHLGKTKADDEPLAFAEILKSNGIEDAIWCLRTLSDDCKEVRFFACDIAEHVLHFFENKFPDDKRPRLSIEAARKYVNGEITLNEMDAARAAAGDAARAAWDAARAAGDAAWAAAGDAAWAAAWAAGDAAVDAAGDAAWAAAWAAGDAAGDAERKWQVKLFIKYFGGDK